ncbi:glucoamylase family protein [soil metagenome]
MSWSERTAAEKRMLLGMQRCSFEYFWQEANEANGLVLDKTADDWPGSIAAVGMALTIYPIGVERGFITRAQAVARTLTTLRFFMQSEQSRSPTATGYKGFYYHFLDMQTGGRARGCELSSIDTALFIAGVLTARAYFRGEGPDERELRALADAMYARVDWAWMQARDGSVRHGWQPERGFLRYRWRGYDEASILYLFGLGSPTHPLRDGAYEAWSAPYAWTTVEGITYLHAGPLFIHQMSHTWVDFRGVRDAFMRAHDSDYFENSRRGVQVQQRYAMRNPKALAMYGEHCWGVTASDGPGTKARGQKIGDRTYYDYTARGVPDGPDDGTLAPWAVAASLPFAPEIVMPTIEYFHRIDLHTHNRYGFKASFNPTVPCGSGHPAGWVSPFHFGIDEGPTVIMIENYRSEMIWRLTRDCPYLRKGLRRAGFEGGWLEAAVEPSTQPMVST